MIKLASWVSMGLLLAACGGGGGGGSSPPPEPATEDPVTEQPAPTPDPGTDPGTGQPGTRPGGGGSPNPTNPTEPENPPGDNEGGSPPTDPDPREDRSIGCSMPAPASGMRTVRIGGLEREYILDVPRNYDNERAYPVVFGFHGRGGKAVEFRSRPDGNILEVVRDDAIVIHPQGVPDPNADVQPERDTWEREGSKDLDFFDEMISEVTNELCVNENQVFVMGMSMGGYFSARLGCERGDAVRGFAAAAAGPPRKSADQCVGRSAAWTAHHPDDTLISFQTEGLPLRDYWLNANYCGAETRPLNSDGNCVEYTNCDAGYPVRWCEHNQSTQTQYRNYHEWPLFAPRESWEFFLTLD